MVEHADELARLIVDDGTGLLVPERRGGNAACVARVGLLVDLAQEAGAVDFVGDLAQLAVPTPAIVAHVRADHRHGDRTFQPLELAQYDRPVRPGAGPGDVQVVPSGLGRKTARSVGRHPISERGRGTDEATHRVPRYALLSLPLALDQHARRHFASPRSAFVSFSADSKFSSETDSIGWRGGARREVTARQ